MTIRPYHVHELGKDSRVDRLVRHYGARWIYFDVRTFPAAGHALKLEALRNNPRLPEVFHRATVHVFEINTI